MANGDILRGLAGGLRAGTRAAFEVGQSRRRSKKEKERDRLKDALAQERLDINKAQLKLQQDRFSAEQFERVFPDEPPIEQSTFSEVKGSILEKLLSGELQAGDPGVSQAFPPGRGVAPVDPQIGRKRGLDIQAAEQRLIEGERGRQIGQAEQGFTQALGGQIGPEKVALRQKEFGGGLRGLLGLAGQQEPTIEGEEDAPGLFTGNLQIPNPAFDPAQSLQFFTGGGQKLEDSLRSLLNLQQQPATDDVDLQNLSDEELRRIIEGGQ